MFQYENKSSVAMTGEDERGKKGFAGLIDLTSELSDVDDTVELRPASVVKPSTGTHEAPSEQRSKPRSEPDAKSSTAHPPAETVSSGKIVANSTWKWLLGIVAVILVFWLASYVNKSKKTSYSTSTPPRTHNLTQSPPPDDKLPGTTRGSEVRYEKPPVGTNHVHSLPQIRWCVRESIRIDTMRDFIGTREAADEFNGMVDDYNLRCSRYRYRSGSLERARREVEANRSKIVYKAFLDAVALGITLNPTTQTGSIGRSHSNTPRRPSTKLTRKVQQLLTELGYKPGPIDGQYGRRTVLAIKAFQRDAGIAQDGLVNEKLLNALVIAVAAKGR